MTRRILACLAMLVLLAPLAPQAALAQSREETLADIRQELSLLYVEVQRLKRELSTTGGARTLGGDADFLSRLDAIEAELKRLNDKTEKLELRIQRIVEDGTRRIGDLEFRLVELEGGDVSKLGETTTLGGEDAALAGLPPIGAAPSGEGEELAVGEEADLRQARDAFDAGDYEKVIALLDTYAERYPDGPLVPAANLLRAEALSRTGRTADAARAFLAAFSGDPTGRTAPAALLGLGRSLAELGQTEEACLTLSEMGSRFPDATETGQAAELMREYDCRVP
ncbi:MAG: tol-pal system protein [Alphaproteobacteria bacterium]|nr:MAG: tol-pal system protein [Alphaproteobacteria bacterium]